MRDLIKDLVRAYQEQPHEYARQILLNPHMLKELPNEIAIRTIAYLRFYLNAVEDSSQKQVYWMFINDEKVQQEYYQTYLIPFITNFMMYFKVLSEADIEVDFSTIKRLAEYMVSSPQDIPICDTFGDHITSVQILRLFFVPAAEEDIHQFIQVRQYAEAG